MSRRLFPTLRHVEETAKKLKWLKKNRARARAKKTDRFAIGRFSARTRAGSLARGAPRARKPLKSTDRFAIGARKLEKLKS